MKKLQVTRLGTNTPITIHAGENSRGVRLKLKYTKGLEIKNYIKINDDIFETSAENITDESADILFPGLDTGTYQAEIVIRENGEILKSGIYTIIVKDSILTNESKKLKSVNVDEILLRLSKAEEEFNSRIKDLDIIAGGNFDKHYKHIQSTAEKEWMILHNLNKYPNVSVIDTGGSQVYGDVKYLDENTIQLKFSYPFSGTAFLN